MLIYRGGVDSMPTEAVGWVIGNEGKVYWIMAILWKSRGLFSRGTVCYRVQDKDGQEYALKDCWVDADKLEQEVDFLRAVDGVPNVVRLRKYWDVKYDGRVDSTSHIRDHVRDHLPDSPIYTNKIHRRMLLTPCGLPLTNFKSIPELVNVFRDLVVGEFPWWSPKFLVLKDTGSPQNNDDTAERSSWRSQSQQPYHIRGKRLLYRLRPRQIHPIDQSSKGFAWNSKFEIDILCILLDLVF